MLERKSLRIGMIVLCAGFAACDETSNSGSGSSSGMGGESTGASGGMGGAAGAGGMSTSGGMGGVGANGGMGGTAGTGGMGSASGGMGGVGGMGGASGGMGGTGGAGGSSAVDCSVTMQTGCNGGFVCEEVEGGKPACFPPLTIAGTITTAMTSGVLPGARVLVRDANESAISAAVFTSVKGQYTVTVPAKRNMLGQPVSKIVSLRVEAAGHQPFPFPPRPANSIDLATAMGDPPVVLNASTDVKLFAYNNLPGVGSVAGRILPAAAMALSGAGATVVAGGATSIADKLGDFVVFNAQAGNPVSVRGFAAGVQIMPQDVSIGAGMQTTGVQLQVTGMATAKVMGNVQMVNVPAGLLTSVALMLPDTYLTLSNRGEIPKGLRVNNVMNSYELTGVPNGTYKVVATFDNDNLVRDPDPNLPSIADIVVNGQDVFVGDSAKLTGALAVVSPGAMGIELVMGNPTFTWSDDAAEDRYELNVFDPLGKLVWTTNVPAVTGSATASMTYAGPQLLPQLMYQFRVTSKRNLVSLSQTEDLRGVFVVAP